MLQRVMERKQVNTPKEAAQIIMNGDLSKETDSDCITECSTSCVIFQILKKVMLPIVPTISVRWNNGKTIDQ